MQMPTRFEKTMNTHMLMNIENVEEYMLFHKYRINLTTSTILLFRLNVRDITACMLANE